MQQTWIYTFPISHQTNTPHSNTITESKPIALLIAHTCIHPYVDNTSIQAHITNNKHSRPIRYTVHGVRLCWQNTNTSYWHHKATTVSLTFDKLSHSFLRCYCVQFHCQEPHTTLCQWLSKEDARRKTLGVIQRLRALITEFYGASGGQWRPRCWP